MNRTNQSTVIKEAINSLLDEGVTDKQDIYSKVVDKLGVPRPTVRRVLETLEMSCLQKSKYYNQRHNNLQFLLFKHKLEPIFYH